MITRGLLILGAFLILEGVASLNLNVIAAGGVALIAALIWAGIELITPLR
jgi:hypothetical protein